MEQSTFPTLHLTLGAEVSSVEEAHTERPRRSAAYPTLPPSKLQPNGKLRPAQNRECERAAAPVENATLINTATPSADGDLLKDANVRGLVDATTLLLRIPRSTTNHDRTAEKKNSRKLSQKLQKITIILTSEPCCTSIVRALWSACLASLLCHGCGQCIAPTPLSGVSLCRVGTFFVIAKLVDSRTNPSERTRWSPFMRRLRLTHDERQ